MKITVFIATTLDGFIADEKGGVEWLNELPPPTDPKEDMGFSALMASIDCLVMGRKTFDQVMTFDVWPYGETPVKVLTHQSAPQELPEGAIVSFTHGSPQQLLEKFEFEAIQHVYLDGGNVIDQFLSAGLIDEFILTQVPVLLGKGISLFTSGLPDEEWNVQRITNYSNGFVQTHLIKKESDI